MLLSFLDACFYYAGNENTSNAIKFPLILNLSAALVTPAEVNKQGQLGVIINIDAHLADSTDKSELIAFAVFYR